jgi:putative transcriptional regulator
MPSLRGKLLVSSVRLGDPNFARSVVLILAHDDNGALGLVLNRPLDVPLLRLSMEILGSQTPREGVLYRGGPCEAAVMVLFDNDALPTDDDSPSDPGTELSPGLRFSGDRRVIEAILNSASGNARFFAGYSGWGAGQLESELEEEAWLLLPARLEHVLGPHDRLWELTRTELILGDRVNPEAIPQDPSLN